MVLVKPGDPRGRIELNFPVKTDRRSALAGQHTEQGGFSAAVCAQEGGTAACGKGKRGPAEQFGFARGKPFALHAQDDAGFHRRGYAQLHPDVRKVPRLFAWLSWRTESVHSRLWSLASLLPMREGALRTEEAFSAMRCTDSFRRFCSARY